MYGGSCDTKEKRADDEKQAREMLRKKAKKATPRAVRRDEFMPTKHSYFDDIPIE